MQITSAEEIMTLLSRMNNENSVSRISVPGIGEFTIVLQRKEGSAAEDIARSGDAEAGERAMPGDRLTRNPYL